MQSSVNSEVPGTSIMHKIENARLLVKRMHESFTGTFLNVTLLAALLYHLRYSCWYISFWILFAEVILVAICSLNAVCHLWRFLSSSLTYEPVAVTPLQRRMLGESDASFTTILQHSTPKCNQSTKTKVNLDISQSICSPEFSKSANLSNQLWCSGSGKETSHVNRSPASFSDRLHNSSHRYHSDVIDSPGSVAGAGYSRQISGSGSQLQNNSWFSGKSSPESSRSFLSQTLPSAAYKESYNYEKLKNLSFSAAENHIATKPIWSPPNVRGLQVVPPSAWHSQPNVQSCERTSLLGARDAQPDYRNREYFNVLRDRNHRPYAQNLIGLKRNSAQRDEFWKMPEWVAEDRKRILLGGGYQPAVVTTTEDNDKAVTDNGGNSLTYTSDQDACLRMDVTSARLSQWTANLRRWISRTILKRLVKEIAAVNKSLDDSGVLEGNIGSIGLQRLKNVVQRSSTVAQNIPSLAPLIAFLDISENQEYVVNRIRELSEGDCMSKYRWNSGGSFRGKEWADSLPTDAALVLHLIATYLDAQLCLVAPPSTSTFVGGNVSGRPFSTAHLATNANNAPVTKDGLVIVRKSVNPPHYVLLVGAEIVDIGKGRNNLFHVILLMMHIVKTREFGMLERVNLGTTGLNMLCILD